MEITARKIQGGSKHQMACLYLRELAHQRGAMAKLPTTAELRQQLGVSIATLDGALREMEQQNVICRKHGSGIYVSPLLQRSIALICDPTYFRGASHSPFWDLLVEESERRASRKNEAFSLHFSAPTRKSGGGLQAGLLREVGEGRVQGVLSVSTSEFIMEQLGETVPLVRFGSQGRWHIKLDYGRLIEMGVAELAQQGCRRLGLWLPGFLAEFSDPAGAPARTEIEIFRAALTSQHLEFHSALVQLGSDDEHQRIVPQEQGYAIARRVFEQPQHTWPDGIVIADDMMTQGALVAMQKLGVRAGVDVKIASHANRGSTVLAGREDELTLIEFDPAEMVGAMFEMLEILMDGQTPSVSSVGIAPHRKL